MLFNKKPHLFFAGEKSPIFPAIHAQAARELQNNPNSEVQIFEGCGHILHLEEIEKFNETVIDFLNKIKKDWCGQSFLLTASKI